MNKDTIELDRRTDFPWGYGVTSESYTESTILNKIIEWSKPKTPICGVSIQKQVYKHLTRVEYENITEDPSKFHKPFNGERGFTPIPVCDRVVYLDIYWQ